MGTAGEYYRELAMGRIVGVVPTSVDGARILSPAVGSFPSTDAGADVYG